MAFIPIPNVGLISSVYQDDDGVEAVNRFYASTISVPTETDLEEMATQFMTSWLARIAGTMMSNWTLTGLTVRAMNEEFGLIFTQSADLPANATVGSGEQPNQVSATITWLTGLVGRSFRGRTYVVGLPLTYVSAGQKRLTDSGQGNLQTAWDGLRQDFEDAGHALQVVSLSNGGVPRTEGVTTPIVAGRANFPLATQRRRLR